MIITKDSEYFDEVNYQWKKVPKHWVGDEVELHNFKIVNTAYLDKEAKSKLSKLRGRATKSISHSNDMWNGDFDSALAQYEDGY